MRAARNTRLVAATMAAALLAVTVYPYLAPAPAGDYRPFPELDPDDRVLILAPHPDDEILGTAGLMMAAQAVGAEVRIVLVTSGDGYSWAARAWLKKTNVSRDDLIAFGQVREAESRTALARLGVEEFALQYLGYPDRGLAALWEAHWEVPATSRFTGRSSDPEGNSTYTGSELLRRLEQILSGYQPTVLLLPHPLDAHSDHWALAGFTLQALARQSTGWGSKPRVVAGYLVHRGAWPLPRAYRPGAGLYPPGTLRDLDLEWMVLPLSSEAVAKKREAIAAFATQRRMMPAYLDSFARANELFGEVKGVILAEDSGAVDGVRIWRDPRSDTMIRRLAPSVDIAEVWARWAGDQITVTAYSRGRLATLARGRLLVTALRQLTAPTTITVMPASAGGLRLVYRGQVRLDPGTCELLVVFQTRLGWWVLDQTPAILLILDRGGGLSDPAGWPR